MPIPGNSNVTITETPTATLIPPVVEQVEGWEFNENYEGATGSRIFIDAFAVPGQPAQDLPQIGAPFSADWPLVTLKSISVKY